MSTQNLHHCQSVQEARNNNNYKHDHKLNKFIKKKIFKPKGFRNNRAELRRVRVIEARRGGRGTPVEALTTPKTGWKRWCQDRKPWSHIRTTMMSGYIRTIKIWMLKGRRWSEEGFDLGSRRKVWERRRSGFCSCQSQTVKYWSS